MIPEQCQFCEILYNFTRPAVPGIELVIHSILIYDYTSIGTDLTSTVANAHLIWLHTCQYQTRASQK